MTSSIAETVNSALQNNGLGGYMSQARPVIDVLNRREAEIADKLLGFATQQGLAEEEAAAALRQAGMYMPEPEPTPTPGTIGSADAQNNSDADLAAVLSRIDNTLNSLASFARDNGWRG